MTNQSASGQHGHCDGGHGHGCLGAEGEDRLFPPVAVLLLSKMTLPMRVVLATSRLNRVFSFLLKIYFVHRARGRLYLSAWPTFGLFTLNLGYFATNQSQVLKYNFCSRLQSCRLPAELVSADYMLKDKEMYTKSPGLHVTTKLQELRLLWDALLHTRLGVRGLPGGGVLGERGRLPRGGHFFEDHEHHQDPRQ